MKPLGILVQKWKTPFPTAFFPTAQRLPATCSRPHKPRAVETSTLATHDPLLGRPGLPAQTLPRHVAVDVDVLDQSLQPAVVLLLADEAQDQQPHGHVVEVARELVQHVHLGGAHRVLVEGVVADGHDHGVYLVGGRRRGRGRAGDEVRVCGGQGQGGVPEVDARRRLGDPRRLRRVDGEVGGGDAEL